MFTGIIQEIGIVTTVAHTTDGSMVEIRAPRIAAASRVGDSVSIDGACLTVTRAAGDDLAFDVVIETLERSTLGSLEARSRVNLEPALRAGEPLGGHIVQGHVDGVAGVVASHQQGFSRVLEVLPPAPLMRYVIEKGSIAIAGVSLTVARRGADAFEVSLVPHTCQATTLGDIEVSAAVNLEVDMFAKYVEQLFASATTTTAGAEYPGSMTLPVSTITGIA